MSIVTPAWNWLQTGLAGSQLPFGFDVDWYLHWCRTSIWGRSRSQLPFGFDVEWYPYEHGHDNIRIVESQLPFGFDVEWYCTIFSAFISTGKMTAFDGCPLF